MRARVSLKFLLVLLLLRHLFNVHDGIQFLMLG